jgi:hypothetical protein
MQALLFVEPDQDAAPEWTVVDIREDVARLGQPTQLLDGLLQRIVPLEGLQLGDDQRGPYQAVLERGRQAVDVVPVPDDPVGA